jgi:hypothetical protein
MSTLKTGALRGTSGTADSVQLHASDQSVTFPGAVTITGALTSSTTSLGPSYATGTWTPAYSTASGSVGTYSQQSGRYTKIGKLVFVTFEISAEDGDADGATKITGLPFTSVNAFDQWVGRYFLYTPGAQSGQGHSGNVMNTIARVTSNSTELRLHVIDAVNEDQAARDFDFGVCSNSFYVRVKHSFCYEAAS